VIKIRYADLPHGLHADVRTSGGRPVIYLLPGLSTAQRRDALRRLIRTSRLGYGPRLRASGVAFAVARDIAKTTGCNGLAAIRCHPAGSAVLAGLIAAVVVCYALFVTVTVRFSPRPAGPPAAAGPAPYAPGTGGPGRSPGGGGRAPAATPSAAAAGHGGSPQAAASSAGEAGPGPSGSGRAASPAPLPTGTWSAPGGVLPSVPQPAPSSAPAPAPSPAPPASPGATQSPPGDPGGLCVRVGPLGVCISG
jgi:hypothetical protein